MAARKRNPLQVARDEEEICLLHLRGDRQEDIGRKLNLSQPMVSYSVKRLRERMNTKTIMTIEVARNKEIALHDEVETCAWAGWERAEREGDSTGAARFAVVILRASYQRSGLLGLPGNPPTPTPPADDADRQQRLERIRAAFTAKVLRDYSNASGQSAVLTNGGTPLLTKSPESAPKPPTGYTMS